MSSQSLMTFAVKLQIMFTTLQQPQAKFFSTDKSNIDLRIDKKEFDIFTEDCSCIIDEVEFVKIIDLKTNMSLPVLGSPQAITSSTPRKSIHKFVSHMFKCIAVFPVTLSLYLVLVLGVGNVWGQTNTSFNDGYISVFRVTSASALANTGTAIVIDEYLPNTVSQSSTNYSSSLATGSSGVVVSGTATSAGAISRSENGRFLIVPGYAAAVGAANTTFTTNGTARLLNGSGTLTAGLGTGSIYTTANDLRGAASDDGTNFWFTGGSLGIRHSTNGATVTTVSSTSTNTRVVNIFNGQLFYSTSSGTNGIYQVGSGKPSSAGTTSTIKAGSTAPYGFSVSPDGLTIYAMGSANTVVRFTYSGSYNSSTFTYSGGSWSTASTGFTLTGVTGIAVDWNAYSFSTGLNGAVVYACNPTTLVRGNDNGTGAITTSTLRTISGNNAFRSLAFSPTKSTVALGSNNPSAGNINPNSTNNIVFAFTYTADEGNVVLKKLTLTNTGTATLAADFSAFRLVLDSDGNGIVSSAERSASTTVTGTISGNNIVFSGLTFAYINQGLTANYLVEADVASGASNNNTLALRIAGNQSLNSINYTTNLSNAGGSWINMGSNSTNLIGNTLTIVAQYNVTYNGNSNTSGTVPTDATNYSSGSTVTVLGNTGSLARTGYTFGGWNTLANGSGTDRAAGSTFTISAITTLFAKWTANNNTITFNGNGSTGGSTASQNINTAASANLTANGFIRSGYTFSGWNTASNGTGVSYADQASYTMGTANVTLYAQWTANSLTVTYDSQGGSAISNGSTTTGGTVSNPGNPTRSGYSFNGWFLASSGGTAISFPYSHGQTSNFTLYAQWTVVASPTVDPVTLSSALSTTYGTESTGVSFTASGSNLNSTITATAQSGYQVSDDNSTFGSSVSISSGTTIYVRFSATQAANNYNNTTAVVLSSTGATNVNVTTSSSDNTVSQKGLTITGISIPDKTYDATTISTISGTAVYSGLVNGESFSVTGTPSAVFNNKNVGTAKPITVSGYTTPSGNYSITQPIGLTADITAKALTITSAAITTKTYDGNTNATITGSLNGVETGDAVTLTGTGTFASANVGTGINVTSISTLGGADAGNYTLTQPTGLTGEITKANQTITFGALANKTTNDTPFNLTATASSGLTVSYTSSNTSVATIVGNTVTIVGVGTTTITASQSGNTNYNSASDIAQTLTVTLADIEEIIFPQYIQGVNGTNANRIPSSYYLKLNNLSPNTTYRFYCGFVTSSDLSTSSGAGNNIYVNYAGGSFTRSTSPSLASAGNYSTLTTNSTGSYTGWFVMEPTGNATRFIPGTNLYLRVTLNDGNNGTTAVNYRTSANTIKVINLVASSGANNGTGLYGSSSAGSKNFAVLYDNTAGTGRPISASFIEDDGTANTTANSYSNFYVTNVNGVSGAFGVVIPNDNSNGIKRIEFKKTSDNSLIYSVTDNDGNWSGTANTVNPTGGTTAISIPNSTFDDATYNETSGLSLSQNTKINGTITLSQGTLNVGPYELTLNGNIMKTLGNIDASNAASTIVFNGSSAQSIPASTFTGNINNLILSNSAGLSISQDLSVNGVLTLSSGKLTLGANHLTLGESATITGTFSSNNMIIATGLGELRKRFAQGSGDIASFTFPVGNGGSVAEYTPIVLDFATGNYGANAYVSVRVQDSKQATLNSSVTNYLNRNWIIEPNDISGFSYKIQLHYVDADFITDGSMTEGDLLPIKISSGQWYQPTDGSFTNAVSQGSAGIFASANYLEWNGLTTFSEFGGAGGSNQPLPVELISFTAECAKETIVLKWQTASEFNSAYFEIQKSVDGSLWNIIGNQFAAGNSTELLSYSFEDVSKTGNTSYYRLNQVDNDGIQKFFGPISPLCESIIHLNGKTIPNPSNNEFWLQISSAEQQKFYFILQDVNGTKIMENKAELLPGANLFPIRETIPSGMYFIVVQTESGQQQVIKHIRN